MACLRTRVEDRSWGSELVRLIALCAGLEVGAGLLPRVGAARSRFRITKAPFDSCVILGDFGTSEP